MVWRKVIFVFFVIFWLRVRFWILVKCSTIWLRCEVKSYFHDKKPKMGGKFTRCFNFGLEKSHLGVNKSTIRTFFLKNQHLEEFYFFLQMHQEDFSPDLSGMVIGQNFLLVQAFIMCELHRGFKGLLLAIIYCLCTFSTLNFRCGHLLVSLEAFFW